ncbi:GNAT family N-acetyltransferase [Cohnella nanjingensis]|uniref:GNAT family N-acetyltransferase n=1 Tax=Cohnella nanjingensis TaxID=1387779 RepID=UPI0028ACFA18|nr:GNAT family N-acetyltransferase [Cohnella nanjingensis]
MCIALRSGRTTPAISKTFVGEDVRGHGAARALIERVAQAAREHRVSRFYWQTRRDNAVAHALYDKVAQHNGFNPLRLSVVI